MSYRRARRKRTLLPVHPILRSLREATVTMLAILAALGTTLLIDPEPGPAVLAVVLTMSLARSQLDRDLRGRLESLGILPLVALASVGVGSLLKYLPIPGAIVFVLGMSASIYVASARALEEPVP
jgi:hypothetical protein